MSEAMKRKMDVLQGSVDKAFDIKRPKETVASSGPGTDADSYNSKLNKSMDDAAAKADKELGTRWNPATKKYEKI